jgi:hypothetical protein
MVETLLRDGQFEHTLAVLILISRIGDVGSTLLVTPNLRLEANPLARRFKWPTLILGFGLAFVPYYSTAFGVMALVPSLLVTASNLGRGWFARGLGEVEMLALLQRAARKSSRMIALGFVLSSAATIGLAGSVLLMLSGGAGTWAYWFALGILTYGLAIAVHGSLFVLRIFRTAEDVIARAEAT